MSIDFSVCINDLIVVGELRAGVMETIAKLTDALIPAPIVRNMDQGVEFEVDDEYILSEDSLGIIWLEGYDSKASLLTVQSLASPSRHACSSSPFWSRSPTEFVLAICCAIWIAERFNSTIVDETCFWINQREYTAEYILSELSIKQPLPFDKACDVIICDRLE